MSLNETFENLFSWINELVATVSKVILFRVGMTGMT